MLTNNSCEIMKIKLFCFMMIILFSLKISTVAATGVTEEGSNSDDDKGHNSLVLPICGKVQTETINGSEVTNIELIPKGEMTNVLNNDKELLEKICKEACEKLENQPEHYIHPTGIILAAITLVIGDMGYLSVSVDALMGLLASIPANLLAIPSVVYFKIRDTPSILIGSSDESRLIKGVRAWTIVGTTIEVIRNAYMANVRSGVPIPLTGVMGLFNFLLLCNLTNGLITPASNLMKYLFPNRDIEENISKNTEYLINGLSDGENTELQDEFFQENFSKIQQAIEEQSARDQVKNWEAKEKKEKITLGLAVGVPLAVLTASSFCWVTAELSSALAYLASNHPSITQSELVAMLAAGIIGMAAHPVYMAVYAMLSIKSIYEGYKILRTNWLSQSSYQRLSTAGKTCLKIACFGIPMAMIALYCGNITRLTGCFASVIYSTGQNITESLLDQCLENLPNINLSQLPIFILSSFVYALTIPGAIENVGLLKAVLKSTYHRCRRLRQ